MGRYNGKGTDKRIRKFPLYINNDNDADWFDGIKQWAYRAYITMTTGDFNGDRKDEIAVYVPYRGNPKVLILDGVTLDTIKEISIKDLMGATGAEMSSHFKLDGRTARATVQISMATGDLDRDLNDELMIVGGYADIHDDSDGKKLKDRSSILGVYDASLGADKSISSINKKASYAFYDDEDYEEHPESANTHTEGMGWLRTASVICADVAENDGFPEIIVAGYYNTDGPDDDSIEDEQFMLCTMAYDGSKLSLNTAPQYIDMTKFVKAGLYNQSDDMQGTPAMCAVASRGFNYSKDIFLAGKLLRYENAQGTPWKEVDGSEPAVMKESDRGIGGSIISNTWVQSATAGNFDSNDMGIEQVAYITGYKHENGDNYWYRLHLAGYTQTEEQTEEGGVYKAGNYYDTGDKYRTLVDDTDDDDCPAADVAAVDVDDDTDTLKYDSKTYEYSNVDVMALLQASPYFADLDYDPGSTAYSSDSGSGSSSSSSNSFHVGPYLEGSVGWPFFKFHAEASYSKEWSWGYEKELTKSFGLTFSNDGDTNKVVLYRTPVIKYKYLVNVAGTNETKDMVIGIQQDPVYLMMDVDEYNKIAKNDNALKDKQITKEILGNEPGYPSTYPNRFTDLKEFTGHKNQVQIYSGASSSASVEQSITTGEQTSNSQTITHSLDFGVGVEGGSDDTPVAFEVAGGVNFGWGWESEKTSFDFKEISKSGEITYPPSTTSEYAFSSRFGTWMGTLANGEDVPILGYIVNNVKQPPSMVQDLTVDSVTEDSVTIGWDEGVLTPEYYEIYQYFDNSLTEDKYSLIGKVPGGETTFTYEDLDPETSYSFAVKSVGMDDGERVETEYTDIVTGTTLSGGDSPRIIGITEKQNVLVGDSANFEIDAVPVGSDTGLSYQWQIREAGSTNWRNIGKSNNPVYTVTDASEDMEGNRFRCIVSQIVKGRRKYAYSDSGILHVGKAESTTVPTAINLDKDEQTNEYYNTNRGFADYSETKPVETETDISKIVSVSIGGEEKLYAAYKNNYEKKDGEDVEVPEQIWKCLEDGEYYTLVNVVESADGKATADQRIPLKKQEKPTFQTDENSLLSEERAEVLTSKTVADLKSIGSPAEYKPKATDNEPSVTYEVYKAVNVEGNSITLYKEKDLADAPYLTYKDNGLAAWDGNEADYTIRRLYNEDPEAEETIDGRAYSVFWPEGFESEDYKVYYTNSSTGEDEYYVKVSKTENNQTVEVLEKLILPETDDFYTGTDGTAVYKADPGDEVMTKQKVITNNTVGKAGDEVTLTAVVTANTDNSKAKASGDITFRMQNNNTGSVSEVTASLDDNGKAEAKWTPAEPGVYTVISMYTGNDCLNSSTGKTIYYALEKENPDKALLVLDAEDIVYGQTVHMDAKKGTLDENGDVVTSELPEGTSISYKVYYKDDSGKTNEVALKDNAEKFTPDFSGKATIYAQAKIPTGDGNSVDADTQKTVFIAKRPLTVKAPSKSGLSNDVSQEKVPKLEDVEISYKDDKDKEAIISKDQEKFPIENLFTIASEPTLSADSGEGIYVTKVDYQKDDSDAYTDTVKAFMKNYEVTFENGTYEIIAGKYNVSYTSGSNGTVIGYEGANQVAFKSDAAIEEGTKLTFAATPNSKFEIDEWKVTDGEEKELEEGTDYTLKDNRLVVDSLSKNINVHVTFKASSYKLTFEAGDHGSVTGAYYKDSEEGTAFTSPENVPIGRQTILKAVPDEGYVVKRWLVTEGTESTVVYKNEDESIYSGTELVLDAMDTDTEVEVEFEEIDSYDVKATIITDEGNNATDCSVTIDGLQDEKAVKGSKISMHVDTPEDVTVKEWRMYKNDTEYDVVENSEEEFTISNIQKDIRMEIVVTVHKKFNVSVEQGGTGKGTYTVTINDKTYTADQISGGKIEAARHSKVTVTAMPESEFDYVASWNGKESDALTYEIADLTDTETVFLNFNAYDTANIQYNLPDGYDAALGSVKSANGDTLDAVGKQLRVRCDGAVEFAITPKEGEQVASWKAEYADGRVEEGSALGYDNKITLKDITSDVTVSVTMEPIKAYTIPTQEVNDPASPQETAYTISGIVKTPDTLPQEEQYVDKVRSNGSETFVVSPAAGREITLITDRNQNSAAQTNVVTVQRQKDGSYLVTISNITNDVDLVVTTEKVYTVTMNQDAHGKITATDSTGKSVESGTKVKEGTVLTFTATPDSDYLLTSWNKPLSGNAGSVTYTINEDTNISAVFAQASNAAEATTQAKEEESITKKPDKDALNIGLKMRRTENKATLSWGRVKEADGYDIFADDCGKELADGKVIKTISSNKILKTSFKKVAGKKLKNCKNYKVFVKAFKMVNGKKEYIAKSYAFHIAAKKDKKHTNVKRIKLNVSKVTLKKGKSKRLKVKLVKEKKRQLLSRRHGARIKYCSSNTNVAKVSATGKITAKGKGTCKVYVISISGVIRQVKVTVK